MQKINNDVTKSLHITVTQAQCSTFPVVDPAHTYRLDNLKMAQFSSKISNCNKTSDIMNR